MGQFFASLRRVRRPRRWPSNGCSPVGRGTTFIVRCGNSGVFLRRSLFLDYLTDRPSARVRRGLLKGEQLHALARTSTTANGGRPRERDWQQQMSRAAVWCHPGGGSSTGRSGRLIRCCATGPGGRGHRCALLPHISPIGWNNVILYGEYALDPRLVRHPHGIPQHRVKTRVIP